VTHLPIEADDVRRAAATIADDIVRTPAAHSKTLSALTGAEVVVKFENLQFTASFKDRGSANKLHQLSDDERSAGVIAMSAGNHAQGVAYHAGRMGIPATIVMPRSAPFTKVANTEALGAEVVQDGSTLADAAFTAERISRSKGLTWVHPYDDRWVISGQGTVALELLEDFHDLDAMLVPVGGGGLIGGIATYAKAVRPDIEIVGIQSEAFTAMVAAFRGEPHEFTPAYTLADGIAVKDPGELTVPIVRALVDDMITVEETTIERAVAMFLEIEKTVSEGAGAVGLAALLEHPDRWRGKRVGLVLAGGNIDTRVLTSVLMKELVHTGRITTLRVTLPDFPGQLAPVVSVVATSGANIIEIDHRRLFDPISARVTNVDLVMETRGPDHAREVVEAIEKAGFVVSDPTGPTDDVTFGPGTVRPWRPSF
jgi:threonine dehydratase